MLPEQQISRLEWFLKDHVTVKTGGMNYLHLFIMNVIQNLFFTIWNKFKSIRIILNYKNIVIFYLFTVFSDQINAALGSIRLFV